ncbi:hypothetical protein E2C01_030325 [Portunus trituberculatus]|uniref:Uncharacterized protein n=1 Tax=Portunus trituberculatus TaxID=210409 RepID=A0A5B7EV22_PORTR|nr:hypothetical protein [Portunus trituberculatus]
MTKSSYNGQLRWLTSRQVCVDRSYCELRKATGTKPEYQKQLHLQRDHYKVPLKSNWGQEDDEGKKSKSTS